MCCAPPQETYQKFDFQLVPAPQPTLGYAISYGERLYFLREVIRAVLFYQQYPTPFVDLYSKSLELVHCCGKFCQATCSKTRFLGKDIVSFQQLDTPAG